MAEIDPALGSGISYLTFISGVVWANIVSVSTFAIMLFSAIIFRNRSYTYKRLILIATVSILGPALARISRFDTRWRTSAIHTANIVVLARFYRHL